MSDPLIRQLVELSARAWPSLVDESFDGWRLRSTDAATRRANSALALSAGERTIDEKIARVEQFYRDRGQTPQFLIAPYVEPPELDALLDARGYQLLTPTSLQTADVRTVLEQTAREDGRTVHVDEQLSEVWSSAYLDIVRGEEDVQGDWAGIFGRIGAQKAFARIDDAGHPAAIGVGVYEDGWLGIFGMGSRLDFRRRGAAIAVLRALVRWGRKQGAKNAYLQVTVDNAPARALYSRMGFTTLFDYHYRAAED